MKEGSIVSKGRKLNWFKGLTVKLANVRLAFCLGLWWERLVNTAREQEGMVEREARYLKQSYDMNPDGGIINTGLPTGGGTKRESRTLEKKGALYIKLRIAGIGQSWQKLCT